MIEQFDQRGFPVANRTRTIMLHVSLSHLLFLTFNLKILENEAIVDVTRFF